MPEKSLTITQAAEQLGVHYQTLRRWADEGKVPMVRLASGYRRFDPAVIASVRAAMGYGVEPSTITDPRGTPGRPRKPAPDANGTPTEEA